MKTTYFIHQNILKKAKKSLYEKDDNDGGAIIDKTFLKQKLFALKNQKY